MDANNNAGAEKVWRTPSRNLCWMADHNSTQRMRSKPYSRWDCSRRTGGRRSDEVDLSAYEIPIMGSKSKLIFAIHPFFRLIHLTTIRRCSHWCDGRCQYYPNAGTIPTVDDCKCHISTCSTVQCLFIYSNFVRKWHIYNMHLIQAITIFTVMIMFFTGPYCNVPLRSES